MKVDLINSPCEKLGMGAERGIFPLIFSTLFEISANRRPIIVITVPFSTRSRWPTWIDLHDRNRLCVASSVIKLLA
jgi:hypothetical protein